MTNLLNKKVTLKDCDGKKTNEWGIIHDYDGEYYWIAFAGDNDDVKPYLRNEFITHRTGDKGI